MSTSDPNPVFDGQFKRLYIATETRTQVELAEFFGIRQSSVSDAKRRGNIPADWLLTLLLKRRIHPSWVLTGNGARFVLSQSKERECLDMEREKDEVIRMLRLLPSQMLTDELLRRIELADAERLLR